MQCPKCSSSMETATFDEVEVDRCTGCKGLWFQKGELARLREETWMADYVLDEGSAKIGRKYNSITAVDCPECGADMKQESDPSQPHIVFETCPEDHGTFLDAGEFTDLLHKTFWDRFKRAR